MQYIYIYTIWILTRVQVFFHTLAVISWHQFLFCFCNEICAFRTLFACCSLNNLLITAAVELPIAYCQVDNLS